VKRGAVYLASQERRDEGRSGKPVEISGVALRPVVLVSRDAINQHSAVVLVCPLVEATSVSQLYPSDVAVDAPEAGLTTDSVVLTGQLRAVARTQLVRNLGELSSEVMRQVDKALRITLDIE
jgi:mRNA interferase MazF